MTTSQRITKRMEATGRTRSKDSIYAVVMDEHSVHCLTEAHIDVWWHSLTPEDKAAIYEASLEGEALAAAEAPQPSAPRCSDCLVIGDRWFCDMNCGPALAATKEKAHA